MPSRFNNALYKSGHIKLIKNLFNSFIDVNSMYANLYDDPIVSEFANILENNSISISQLNTFAERLGTVSPQETVLAINNKISKGRYFDIKFIGAEKVLFNRVQNKPEFEFDVINSEYYGELLDPIMSTNGYNIVKYQNNYYISEYILTNAEDLPKLKFSSLSKAKGYIEYRLRSDKLSQNRLSNKVKYSKKVIESRKQVQIGDRFTALDISLTNSPLTAMDNKLLDLSYEGFHTEMETSKLWKAVITQLSENGLDLHSILNTPEKIETFILLRASLRNKTEYLKVYSNKSPRIDTPEKINFEYNLANKALTKIKNAKTVVYEIVDKLNSKISLKRVNTNNDIPVYQKKQKSFKSDLVEIASYLSKNFGVLVELLTSSEINDVLKKRVPNAGKVRAFILDNKIYVNIDSATVADPIHEFSHIIMGTIKAKAPDVYYGLVAKVEELPDYNERLALYAQENRARTDINEEIFVTVFSEYFTLGKNKIFKDAFEISKIELLYKEGARKVFQTNDETLNEKVGILMNMSIEELLLEFGSTLLLKDSDLFDLNISSSSRIYANLILTLITNGNLKEDCN